jgi:hypothetical protein
VWSSELRVSRKWGLGEWAEGKWWVSGREEEGKPWVTGMSCVWGKWWEDLG